MCFENKSGYDKVVSFHLMGPDDIVVVDKKSGLDGSFSLNLESEQKLASEIQSLSNSIRFLNDDLSFLNRRLKRHSASIFYLIIASKSTNSRVFWWTILQVGLVIAVCAFQNYYLRSFFEKRRF